MINVVIGIGSNCGNREDNIRLTLDWLKEILDNMVSSDIYSSACVGNGRKEYFNAVVKGMFNGSQENLQLLCKQKELEMGRDEDCRKREDVPVDIDPVIIDGLILKEWDYRQKFFQRGFLQVSDVKKNELII
ncbi:MAG: 2-amino-4-hydroxy-6-hydroxymethyldihydropteridine diphosphokinase [Muribaculaceae bacterium]|nr:2-amino-4-hydroxy-6-hydroxymethyldihydropteridine diphosphokinase [Muribaculaceae bacterium]